MLMAVPGIELSIKKIFVIKSNAYKKFIGILKFMYEMCIKKISW